MVVGAVADCGVDVVDAGDARRAIAGQSAAVLRLTAIYCLKIAAPIEFLFSPNLAVSF
jgi:hypothetical protein